MFRTLSQKFNRKKSDPPRSSYYSDAILKRGAQPVSQGVEKKPVTRVAPEGPGAPKVAFVSAANYRANDPQTDSHVLKADSKHLLTAVLSAKPSARGAHYLRQHLYNELLAQLRLADGDAPRAILATLQQLNTAFRNLHPFNPNVTEGVQLALAFADFERSTLTLASNGGCRCAVGYSNGGVVALEVGRRREEEGPRELGPGDVTSVHLTKDVETIILGSTGFWHEVAPSKALLRLHHYHEAAPEANEGSAAAHMTNFALHCITRRMRSHTDPRMRSLRSVSNLLSLHPGDVSQYKWGGKQPVRRRRGDVHGDLTTVVVRLDWQGTSGGSVAEAAEEARRQSSRARWALLRMHYLGFAAASRAQTRQKWQQLVDQALAVDQPAVVPSPVPAKTEEPRKGSAYGHSRAPSFDVSARAIAAEAG